MSVVLWLTLGIVIGAAAALLFRRKPKNLAPPPTPDSGKTYGHPNPPVSTLRKRLPQPPTDHVWEISVVTNNAGEPLLTLVLLNVPSGKQVAKMSANLVRGGYPWDTWAAYYRNYSIRSSRVRGFDDKVIAPFVDWAASETRKFTPEGTLSDYTIG